MIFYSFTISESFRLSSALLHRKTRRIIMRFTSI